MENSDRKNKRKKRLVESLGVPEKNIYYNLKNQSHFDVLVSMRIEGKPIQRSKENIQFIGEARKIWFSINDRGSQGIC